MVLWVPTAALVAPRASLFRCSLGGSAGDPRGSAGDFTNQNDAKTNWKLHLIYLVTTVQDDNESDRPIWVVLFGNKHEHVCGSLCSMINLRTSMVHTVQ